MSQLSVWTMSMTLLLSAPLHADDVDQLIIKYRSSVQARMSVGEVQARAVQAVVDSTGIQASYKRAMSPVTGAHVLKLPYSMSREDARAYAAAVMAGHSELDYVEPDGKFHLRSVTPSDPYFADQWHFKAPAEFAGAANLTNAWDLTRGSADVVVAVLDSGVTQHPDLQANLVGGRSDKAGYDMISAGNAPGDGDGRDADPSDPGAELGLGGSSSWHGTVMAGIVAATPDNGRGVAGAGWNTRVLAVRILSDQGGTISDGVDGMLWAAGEPVPGAPLNTTPAQILNLSLGTDYFEACSRTAQAAIDVLKKKGVSVVAAAGNENRNVQGSAPANCSGVLAVTGVMRDGARAPFANYGSMNTIAAPAMDIMSLSNTGINAPAEHSLRMGAGTSRSAPQVAGVLALMLGANPALRNPAVVVPAELPVLLANKLKQSARPFPTAINGSSEPLGCDVSQSKACVCTTSTCGAGLLDAYQAVMSVTTAPFVSLGANQSVAGHAPVVLDGSASKDDTLGKIVRYAWTQVAGTSVVLTGADTAKAGFTAPATTETLIFQLMATDDTGLTSSAQTEVKVTTAIGGGADAGAGTNTGGGAAGVGTGTGTGTNTGGGATATEGSSSGGGGSPDAPLLLGLLLLLLARSVAIRFKPYY